MSRAPLAHALLCALSWLVIALWALSLGQEGQRGTPPPVTPLEAYYGTPRDTTAVAQVCCRFAHPIGDRP